LTARVTIEGGIFWITVRLPEKDPYDTPLMRFQTKIYHPNISPQGHICADFKDHWNSILSAGIARRLTVSDPSGLWYHGKSTEIRWSLGGILTALCGLLASPDVDDPLVPEIAQKYLEDYEGYCENARKYTKRFATKARPEEDSLTFLEEPYVSLSFFQVSCAQRLRGIAIRSGLRHHVLGPFLHIFNSTILIENPPVPPMKQQLRTVRLRLSEYLKLSWLRSSLRHIFPTIVLIL
jgi:ubiquitin-protein ligase